MCVCVDERVDVHVDVCVDLRVDVCVDVYTLCLLLPLASSPKLWCTLKTAAICQGDTN